MGSQEVGSMDVVMNYKDNGLKKGMDDSKKDFKEAKQSGKSMNEEMSRLSAVSVATGQAIFQVAAGLLNMFKNGLTSSPYLIGAFTRMKTDVTILFWKLTKYLKPAFDLLADAIHALTTGDWKGFVSTLKKAWQSIKDAIGDAWQFLLNLFGEDTLVGKALRTFETIYTVVSEAVVGIATWIAEYDWASEGGVWNGIKEAMGIVFDKVIQPLLPDWVNDIFNTIAEWLKGNQSTMDAMWALLFDTVPWAEIGKDAAIAFWDGFKEAVIPDWLKKYFQEGIDINEQGTARTDFINTDITEFYGNEPAYEDNPRHGGYTGNATGLYVPSDGMYKLHAGENVQPAGTYGGNGGGGNATNITVDFSGSNISLGNDMDLDKFANVVSQKIADEQAWRAY